LFPIAAWIGISNCCLGISFLSFSSFLCFLGLSPQIFYQVFAKHFMDSPVHKFGVAIDTKSL